MTAVEEHDIKQAESLIEDMECERVVADRGYDSDALREYIVQNGATAVIPPKSNRKMQYSYDEHIYKERHLIECLFNKAKQFRRVFSRYDKFADTYPTNRGSTHLAEMKCPHNLVPKSDTVRLIPAQNRPIFDATS